MKNQNLFWLFSAATALLVCCFLYVIGQFEQMSSAKAVLLMPIILGPAYLVWRRFKIDSQGDHE